MHLRPLVALFLRGIVTLLRHCRQGLFFVGLSFNDAYVACAVFLLHWRRFIPRDNVRESTLRVHGPSAILPSTLFS